MNALGNGPKTHGTLLQFVAASTATVVDTGSWALTRSRTCLARAALNHLVHEGGQAGSLRLKIQWIRHQVGWVCGRIPTEGLIPKDCAADEGSDQLSEKDLLDGSLPQGVSQGEGAVTERLGRPHFAPLALSGGL